MAEKEFAIVDGANIAYIEKTDEGKPKVANIVAVRQALIERGFEPVVLVDASLHYEVDDPEQLEGLLKQQKVRQAPAETDADYFVLETAERLDGVVVTNDRYEAYRDRFPAIDERRLPVMIIRGKVEFYQPSLDQEERPR